MVFLNQHINFPKNCKFLLINKTIFIGFVKENVKSSFLKIQVQQGYNLFFYRGFVKSAKIDKTSILNKKTVPIKKIKYSLGQRKSLILPKHIGRVFFIHNGKSFLSVHISPKMLGHKFGEFASTRKKPYHKKN